MPLKRLLIENFRNIKNADIVPAPRFNFVYGDNGSGKTSVLEVISSIGLGRSFRTRKFSHLVNNEAKQFQLFGEILQSNVIAKVGVARAKGGASVFRCDGGNVRSAGHLAELLPMQIINTHSFSLLEGGPSERRRFLDWMVFHVKHPFKESWKEYNRCLKQRNTLLRQERVSYQEFLVWDKQLVQHALAIHGQREDVMQYFKDEVEPLVAECEFLKSGENPLSLEYESGWKDSTDYLSQLEHNFEKDRRYGYSTLGAHKADIKITFNSRSAVDLFSRGQQKSVIAAMYIAQLRVFNKICTKDCLLLIDDLPAEMDSQNTQRLCSWLSELENMQFFITGIDLDSVFKCWPDKNELRGCKLFHVKHGQIIEQPSNWSNI